MNKKIFLATVIFLFCLSCNKIQKSEKKFEIQTDTMLVSRLSDTILDNEQDMEKYPESALFDNLTCLSQRKIHTELKFDTTYIEPVPFTSSDWDKIKKSYNIWRNSEIKKGNYQEECPDISEQDEDNYADRLGVDALPKIPIKFKRDNDIHYGEGYIDTLMADINFDGKMDIVFKIDPSDCMGSIGSGATVSPTILLSFLSKGNEYQMDNNWIISKALRTIQGFNSETGDSHSYPELVFLKSISAQNGIIILSGSSATSVCIGDDHGCCPSFLFTYKFNYYMDKLGKGYAEIEGTYTNEQKATKQKFCIRYTRH